MTTATAKKPRKKPAKPRGGWRNSASAKNGLLGGGPEKENLLEGLTNLDTGEPAAPRSVYFPSARAAAFTLGIDMAILKDARAKDCPAFIGGFIHRERLLDWLRIHHPGAMDKKKESPPAPEEPEEDFVENYQPPDEVGGVGQTLKSLQAYERRLKRKLDDIEKSKDLHPALRAEKVKQAQDAWIKVVNSLLKYDLAVDMAKRESGELLPMADAVKGVQALLAWHTVGTSDALRNVIPECEGKNKYEIAALLDPALRSAIYRNFKLGMKLGKIPEWMGRSASEFMQAQHPLSLDVKPVSTNLDDY